MCGAGGGGIAPCTSVVINTFRLEPCAQKKYDLYDLFPLFDIRPFHKLCSREGGVRAKTTTFDRCLNRGHKLK